MLVSDTDATANAVDEDATSGTVVGITALASDPDSTDTVTYSLTSNPGNLFANRCEHWCGDGDRQAWDAETATSHDIDVTATSTDGSTSVQTFTIAGERYQ